MNVQPAHAEVRRPVMRYFGSKWRIAEWVIEHFPAHRHYVEPFGGSGSVLLRKPRAPMEVYNDLDGAVVNVFRVLRDPTLSAHLRYATLMTPYARQELLEATQRPNHPDPVEWARRTIVRATFGVGSRGRALNYTLRQGDDSAGPWSRWHREVKTYTERLAGVVVEHLDGVDLLEKLAVKEDTLVYADPPYLESARLTTARYPVDFTEEDHRRLARALRSTMAMVVLSGYASPLYEELYDGWEWAELKVGVGRHPKGGKQRKRRERLWFNRAAVLARSQLAMFDG